MQRGRLQLLFIPLAALIAVLPLIFNGCSCGHDFDFHIVSWLEAARQFSHGNFLLHWAYAPAFNAGEPRFVFYPPASWTIGAVLALIFPIAWTPILYTFLVLTVAGFALHRLALNFASPSAALLAAIFYVVNPYTLFTAYERTAYAELLAAILIPILLDTILRPASRGLITIPRIAIPIALLWLTNAPAAVMGSYAFAVLAAIRVLTAPVNPPLDPRTAQPIAQSRLDIALTATAGAALGIALASFYIVPAAFERRYVHIDMAVLFGLRVQDNTLFHTTTAGLTDPTLLADAIGHDQVLHTASLLTVLLLVLTAAALLLALRNIHQFTGKLPSTQISSIRATLYSLAALALIITFLVTRPSLPLWHHLPELAFLQFPWRLLALLVPILALAISLATRPSLTQILTQRTRLFSSIALSITIVMAPFAYHLFRQGCDLEDTPASISSVFHSSLHPTPGAPSAAGFDPTDEYTPITADNDFLRHSNPPYWLSAIPNSVAPVNLPAGPAPASLTLRSPIPQVLILNLRNYPAWHITLNDALVITRYPRPDGLIAIPIPAGQSSLTITYARLPDQTIGNIVTFIALILLLVLVIPSQFKPSPQRLRPQF